MRMPKLRSVFSWAAMSLLVVASLASAEPYFGLYGGVAFPRQHDVRFSEFRRLVGPPGLSDVTVRDDGFETSGVIGGKFGYFLEPLPFLGFELDVFNIFGPDIDAARTRTLDTTIGNITAPVSTVINTGDTVDINVTNVFLNVVGRFRALRDADFPDGRLQPYVGGGGGWVNATVSLENRLGGSDGDATNALGVQGIAGLKYFVAPYFALFTEYKYYQAFNLKWSFSGSKIQTDLSANTAVAGVAFHFPKRVAAPPPPPPVAPPPPPPPPAPPPERRVERIVLQSVHFEFDKSRLTPLGRRVLDEAAQKMKDDPRLLVDVEGNTDSIGTELYNLGLGQRRAEVVKGYLVLRHQVDPKRMTTVSYGETRPIADNRTAEGRALNRRVEFKVLIR
jgi:outer membrane protein OmpA-like peptidoglycan-associated protein